MPPERPPRRADRLFAALDMLRDGGRHTAGEMAGRLGVSTRTLWRDMEMLAASGAPVEGTRGLGYRLRPAIALPPLHLTLAEAEALRLGLDVVASEADAELRAAARMLAGRLDAALPPSGTAGWKPATPAFTVAARGFPFLPVLRRAIRDRHLLRLRAESPDGAAPERLVRPLQLDYGGRLWALTAWCGLRNDFRVFRVDRLLSLDDTGETFADEPGKRLSDYLARFAGGPDGN